MALFAVSIENLKNLKYNTSSKKQQFFLLFEHFLILASTITGCISISAFASLLDIPIESMSSAIGLKNSAIAAGVKKYKSIIKKKKKKHDKSVLLGKFKLNNMELLTSKALIDSNISLDEFVSVNNVLKEYDEIKKLIRI